MSKFEVRRMGFPWSELLVRRERMIGQGTLDLARYALKNNSIGLNIAGGTHHACSGHAEGFCMLNDFAIVALELIDSEEVDRILIIDLDVHQGNGTAQILGGHKNIFCCSVHGANNYPLDKQQSHLDIPLPDNTTDEQYLQVIQREVLPLLQSQKPELVMYNSGVDLLASDKLGRFSLSMEGIRQRDQMVLESCCQMEIPVVVSMGGGYSKDIKEILEAHTLVYRIAFHLWA